MKMMPMLLLLLAPVGARAACVDSDAWTKHGSWTVQVSADGPLRDFPSSEFARARKKGEQAIELLKRALPSLRGVDAKAYLWGGGAPDAEDGSSLRYAVNSLYKGYYCVPDTPMYPQVRGTVRLGDETGTWIYIDFNNLGWLVNDLARLDREIKADDGGAMYYFPRSGGELKGLPILLPQIHRGQTTEAYILVPSGALPYRFISREELLKAQIKVWEGKVKEMEKAADPRLRAYPQSFIDRSRALLDSLTPEERKMDAVVRDAYPDPRGKQKYFIDEAAGGRRVFTKNPAFFDPKLPAAAVQFITVYLRYETGPKNRAKEEMGKQFRNEFDFLALRGLLDR
jgi:hypothetical protein